MKTHYHERAETPSATTALRFSWRAGAAHGMGIAMAKVTMRRGDLRFHFEWPVKNRKNGDNCENSEGLRIDSPAPRLQYGDVQ